jgi:hypothetical protein
MLRAILATAALEPTGLAVLAAVVRGPWRYGAAARLGLAFGVGLTTFASGLFLGSCAGLEVRVTGTLVFLAAVAASGRRRAWPGAGLRLPSGASLREWDRSSRVLLAVIAAVLVATTVASLLEPVVEWDVIAIWALKAKVLAGPPRQAASYFHDLGLAYSHLDYPLLWPYAMAWIWSWTRDAGDVEAPKVLGPALLAAMTATFYGLARTRASRRHALLFTMVLVGIPMVTSQTARLLADAPMAYLLLGACGCVELWLRESDGDALRLAGILAGGVILTKNEGLAAAVCLAAATIVALAVQRRQEWRRAALWIAAVPFAIAGPWLLFRTTIPKVHENYGTLLNPVNVVMALDRLPDVLGVLLPYVLAPADWLLLWPAVVLVLALGVPRWGGQPLLVLP